MKSAKLRIWGKLSAFEKEQVLLAYKESESIENLIPIKKSLSDLDGNVFCKT